MKWESHLEYQYIYEKERLERQQEVRRIKAILPFIRCLEILRELR